MFTKAKQKRQTRAIRVFAVVTLAAVTFAFLGAARGGQTAHYDGQENSYSNTMGRPYLAGPGSHSNACFGAMF